MNNAHILVVDDFEDIRLLTTKMLEGFSDNIYQASNGLEALKILDENKQIDLVLLDIMMPVMDGFKTMVEINKMKSSLGDDFKVCFLSAKRDKLNIATALKLGGNDYMIKPLDEEILKSKVACLLGEGTAEDSFASLQVNYLVDLVGLPIKIEMMIASINEATCKIKTSLEFKLGSELQFSGTSINHLFGGKGHFSGVVLGVIKDINHGYEMEVSFLGVPEEQLQQIRKLVINGRN
jgi:CheY-like chemotaxis protein